MKAGVKGGSNLTVKMRFWGGRRVAVRLAVPLAVASVAAGRRPDTMSFSLRSASCVAEDSNGCDLRTHSCRGQGWSLADLLSRRHCQPISAETDSSAWQVFDDAMPGGLSLSESRAMEK